ncbi:MAG: transport protein TonB [Firmicutes bacterium]|nr:transport protein TonB [Bacillota bacterium]
MGRGKYWRSAIALSVLIHLMILAVSVGIAKFTVVRQPTEEYLELELVNVSLATNDNTLSGVTHEISAKVQGVIADTVVAARERVDSSSSSPDTPEDGIPPLSAKISVGNTGAPTEGKSAIQQQGENDARQNVSTTKSTIRSPQILEKIDPNYPDQARRQGCEGTTIVKLEVLATGHVGAVKVEHSSGYPILDDAAVKAVRKWRFIPASDNASGIPVGCVTTIPLVFRLN